MGKPSILITGASGFLGYVLCSSLADDYAVTGTYRSNSPSCGSIETVQLDLEDDEDVFTEILSRLSPSRIIHAAALADADKCEENPELAWRVNVDGSRKLARAAGRIGIPMIYISTDLVYSVGTGPFDESRVNPAMVYSQTKRSGEMQVLSAHPDNIVLRCALMYGPDDGRRISFVRRMDWVIRSGGMLTLFTDQYRTPLWAQDVASAIPAITQRTVSGHIFNLGGPDRLTRYDFGLLAAEVFGWPEYRIRPVRIADLPHLAFRSHDCSMDSGLARRELGWEPTPVRRGLELLRKLWG
ncbi:SDR family oxidoreductase [bacterium]|nr:SDR family oxidoreductase [candidate division CSSED10-310 bacterium]